jgi:hypothetical protein
MKAKLLAAAALTLFFWLGNVWHTGWMDPFELEAMAKEKGTAEENSNDKQAATSKRLMVVSCAAVFCCGALLRLASPCR